jgi:c-di-GMP-binding flagellar brake protein YcgR
MTAFDDAPGYSRGTSNWDRRRGQRAEVLWKGNYLVVDPFTSLVWQRCYLVDLSESGAAVEIHGDDLEVGQRILVRLDPHPTYHDSWLQLRALVVNFRETTTHRVYGLAFAGLVEAQREHFLQITMTAQRKRRPRRR